MTQAIICLDERPLVELEVRDVPSQFMTTCAAVNSGPDDSVRVPLGPELDVAQVLISIHMDLSLLPSVTALSEPRLLHPSLPCQFKGNL